MLRFTPLLFLSFFLTHEAQSTPASQDDLRARILKLRRLGPGGSPDQVVVPRGYAVVIGVAKYQNLDSSAQLEFPESDAEALYRVLISDQGGAFLAENVHILKG